MRGDAGRASPVTPVAVIGLGVIGGSLARALAGDGGIVSAVSPDESERAAAARLGIRVHAADDAGVTAAVTGAQVVCVAVPIAMMRDVIPRVLQRSAAGVLIMHAAGLQSPAALGLGGSMSAQVIGTHPLAGSHASGFGASDQSLFRHRTVLVEDRASAPQREIIERVWRAAGAARFRYADADTHDRAMAWSSHLPQLVATALAATIAREGVQADLAGPGLLDTTRLSMSPLALWRSVLWAAPADALRAVAAMESALKELRTALEHRDEPAIRALWEQAGAWRAAVQSQ